MVRLIYCQIILTAAIQGVVLPLTWHQSPSRIAFALRSSDIRCLLFYLDHYGGPDPSISTLTRPFPQRTVDVLGSRLSVVFRRRLRLGNFPTCWRQANDTAIPQGPPSSSVANFRQISITSAKSNVLELLVSVRLGRFTERIDVLRSTKIADRKGLGACDAFMCVSHTLQSARVDRKLGECRLTSGQPMIGLTIREFSVRSVLWVLGVLCCLN